MPKCLNCGHSYRRYGKGENDGVVLGCPRCFRAFPDESVEDYLNKFWRL